MDLTTLHALRLRERFFRADGRKRVEQAKTYTVQQNTDINDPSKWTQIAIITKTKYLVSGLTSGTKYWFRVQAVGTAGEGPMSDPYVKYAP